MNHLNELIALELGWVKLANGVWRDGPACPESLAGIFLNCPNYSEDLNLMHDIEGDLTGAEQTEYAATLGENVFADAEQKALAWLKVKGVKL